MSLYIAAYDISEDRRRSRVAHFLLQYGARVQRSVYEVFLEPDELLEFRREIGTLLDPRDEFLLVPVDERGNRTTSSWQRELAWFDAVILV